MTSAMPDVFTRPPWAVIATPCASREIRLPVNIPIRNWVTEPKSRSSATVSAPTAARLLSIVRPAITTSGTIAQRMNLSG